MDEEDENPTKKDSQWKLKCNVVVKRAAIKFISRDIKVNVRAHG